MRKMTVSAILLSLFLLGNVGAAQAQEGHTPDAPYRWALTEDGSSELWRQSDGGWQSAGIIPAAVTQVVTSAATPDRAYALTRFDLYVTDDGALWRKADQLPGIPTALGAGQQTPGLLYLGTSDLGAFRSEDGGATWQPLAGLGLQPGTILDVSALAVNPADDHLVFVTMGYWMGSTTMHYTPLGISVTVNSGASWLPVYQAPANGPRIEQLVAEAQPSLTVQAVAAGEAHWYRFDDAELLATRLQTGTPAERAAAVKALALLMASEYVEDTPLSYRPLS